MIILEKLVWIVGYTVGVFKGLKQFYKQANPHERMLFIFISALKGMTLLWLGLLLIRVLEIIT